MRIRSTLNATFCRTGAPDLNQRTRSSLVTPAGILNLSGIRIETSYVKSPSLNERVKTLRPGLCHPGTAALQTEDKSIKCQYVCRNRLSSFPQAQRIHPGLCCVHLPTDKLALFVHQHTVKADRHYARLTVMQRSGNKCFSFGF